MKHITNNASIPFKRHVLNSSTVLLLRMPMEIVNPDLILEADEAEEPEVSEGSETEEEREGLDDNRKEKRRANIQRELADAIVRLAPLEELKILLKCGANVSARLGICLNTFNFFFIWIFKWSKRESFFFRYSVRLSLCIFTEIGVECSIDIRISRSILVIIKI